MKLKKVAIIGTTGIPANYGGFETLAEHLVENLKEEIEFTVYCSTYNYTHKPKTYKKARLVYIPVKANGTWGILYDMISIIHSLWYAESLLILGVGGAFLLPLVKILSSKKIIVNIDGLEWKRDKWGKLAKRYLYVQEAIAVKNANAIIADNLGIQIYLKERYNIQGSLITYGGNHTFPVKMTASTITKYDLPDKYAFSVCRIEPENNVHLILEAFAKLKNKLIFVGNWNSGPYGRDLKQKYNQVENLILLDPIYDQKTLNEIRSNCQYYIHGHSAGGTNPSLVEAMWLGLAIIALDINYNRFTTQESALFFNSAEELRQIVERTPEEVLISLKSKSRKVAIDTYQWNQISTNYMKLF